MARASSQAASPRQAPPRAAACSAVVNCSSPGHPGRRRSSAGSRSDGPQPAVADAGEADRHAAAQGLDHPTSAGHHRHMPTRRALAAVDEQVAGLEPTADAGEVGELVGRGPRDRHPGGSPGRPGQPGAVVGVGAFGAPAVGLAPLGQGERDRPRRRPGPRVAGSRAAARKADGRQLGQTSRDQPTKGAGVGRGPAAGSVTTPAPRLRSRWRVGDGPRGRGRRRR